MKPAYLFAVDVCMIESEFASMKDAIIKSLQLLPPDSLVAFITFGTTVNLYELGFDEIPKCYVFRGDKDVTPTALRHLLGLESAPAIAAAGGGAAVSADAAGHASAVAISAVSGGQLPHVVPNAFLRPLQECEFTLTSILEG